jgi:beta-glucanase (GH16 family)
MKRSQFITVVSLLWLAAVSFAQTVPPVGLTHHSVTPGNPDAVLLFDDEFDGTSLNTAYWNQCYPESFSSWGCSNDSSIDLEWFWKNNVSVANGYLNLTAMKQQEHGYNYTSGMIATGGSPLHQPGFTFLYGYMEMSAQFPPGKGMWPGFWLLPIDATSAFEIDALEWQGGVPDLDYATIHWGSDSSETVYYTGDNLSAGFHTYGLDWEADSVTWYFDGKVIKTFTNASEICNVPMYVIVDLAVGGWVSFPDKTTHFPANMLVDYVQVWSQYPGAH